MSASPSVVSRPRTQWRQSALAALAAVAGPALAWTIAGVAGLALAWAAAGVAAGVAAGGEEEPPPVVFAAASTAAAMTDLGERFHQATGRRVTLSFAASSTLSRQILHGARAALFLTANPAWLRTLDDAGLLADRTATVLLGNRLALIRHTGTLSSAPLDTLGALPGALGDGPLLLGDPAHVPAGGYAREALEHFGVWEKLQGRLAFAPNARAVTARVARGEAAFGITYASELRNEPRVTAAAFIPQQAHSSIRYQLALIRPADSRTALAFHDFLLDRSAQGVFRAHGFAPAGP